MGLWKCKACENLFNTKASKCPNCGAPAEKRDPLRYLGFAIVVLFVGILGTVAYQQKQRGNQERHAVSSKIEEPRNRAMEVEYRKLLALYNDRKFSEARGALQSFKLRYGDTVYKDVPHLEREFEIDRLKEKAKRIPVAKERENLAVYRELLSLDPDNPRYKQKITYYRNALKKKEQEQRRREEEKRLRAKNSRGHEDGVRIGAPF